MIRLCTKYGARYANMRHFKSSKICGQLSKYETGIHRGDRYTIWISELYGYQFDKDVCYACEGAVKVKSMHHSKTFHETEFCIERWIFK